MSNYGYIPDGYIPDVDLPEYAAEFDAMAGKYDPDGSPAIVTWDSFRPTVERLAEETEAVRRAGYLVLWWKVAQAAGVPLWRSMQGNLGSCAGWSAANGKMIANLYQMMLGAFRFVEINPLAMWAKSKNWSTAGGQSMSKVLTGGNTDGNWPVDVVGPYATTLTPAMIAKIKDTEDIARQNQFGACRLTGSGKALAEKIVLCLRAGLVVPAGNNVAVSGARTDANGMRRAALGGSWMHATLLDGLVVVNGVLYVHWTNSHGDNRYGGADRFDCPGSGCWMTFDELVRFLSGRYVDAFVITRAEAPVDPHRGHGVMTVISK